METIGSLSRVIEEVDYQLDRIRIYKENSLNEEWIQALSTMLEYVRDEVEFIHSDCIDEDILNDLRAENQLHIDEIKLLKYEIGQLKENQSGTAHTEQEY